MQSLKIDKCWSSLCSLKYIGRPFFEYNEMELKAWHYFSNNESSATNSAFSSSETEVYVNT